MKKRMRQLTTIRSILIFKYTCSVCMCHEEIHAQKYMYIVHVYMYIHICHTCTYAVYRTQHWILLPVVVYTRTCSTKYGVLRRKVASSPGSPPHQRTFILDLCTRRKIRQGRAWYVTSHT